MLKRSPKNMDPEALILATFEGETTFKPPCLPNRSLELDVFEEVDDASILREHVEVFSRFLGLTSEELQKAGPYAYEMFKMFESTVEPSCLDVAIDSVEQVWSEIEFEVLNLIRGADGKVYAQLPGECSWDPEHGIQFVFLDGDRLSRVSSTDGHYSIRDTPGLPEPRG